MLPNSLTLQILFSTLTQFTLHSDTSSGPYGMDYQIRPGLHIRIDLGLDRFNLSKPRPRIAPSLFIFSNQSMEDDEDFEESHSETNSPLGKVKVSTISWFWFICNQFFAISSL